MVASILKDRDKEFGIVYEALLKINPVAFIFEHPSYLYGSVGNMTFSPLISYLSLSLGKHSLERTLNLSKLLH